jgi:hypothetical protein
MAQNVISFRFEVSLLQDKNRPWTKPGELQNETEDVGRKASWMMAGFQVVGNAVR